MIHHGGLLDMAEVERFEDKVKEALRAVMKHAVAGHGDYDPRREIGSMPAYHHTFCNDAAHALHILAEAGIRPVNDAVAARVLDNQR